MKTKFQFFRWLLILMLSLNVMGAWAQSGPYANTGAQTVCKTGQAEQYGVINTDGSTYTWTVDGATTSPNWLLTSTTTNLATILWKTAGTYTVQVLETNATSCSNPSPVTVVVTVNDLPLPTIGGNATACLNSTGNVYTTEAGMTGYAWTVSAGGIITAGGTGTDNTITVTWNTAGSQSVSVNYNNGNGCAAATPTAKNVTVNPLPATSPIYHN